MKSIEQVRRERLAELVAEERSQAAFARRIGKDKNQVNQWLGRAGSRNMSGETAREIERVLGKPAGWLDQDGGGSASQPAGLDVDKLAGLIETVEAAVAQSGRPLPPRTKARILTRLYVNDQASAASSPEAVRAALASLLEAME